MTVCETFKVDCLWTVGWGMGEGRGRGEEEKERFKNKGKRKRRMKNELIEGHEGEKPHSPFRCAVTQSALVTRGAELGASELCGGFAGPP